jgi:hypothetical protein
MIVCSWFYRLGKNRNPFLEIAILSASSCLADFFVSFALSRGDNGIGGHETPDAYAPGSPLFTS